MKTFVIICLFCISVFSQSAQVFDVDLDVTDIKIDSTLLSNSVKEYTYSYNYIVTMNDGKTITFPISSKEEAGRIAGLEQLQRELNNYYKVLYVYETAKKIEKAKLLIIKGEPMMLYYSNNMRAGLIKHTIFWTKKN